MKKLLLALFITILLPCAFAANGDVLKASVTLSQIAAEKTVEKRGDELYLTVTVYPAFGARAQHYQIPRFPLHYSSEHLEKIKHLSVWAEGLADGEAVTLVIALIEKDVIPWNTDDLIGQIKLHLKNEKGQLKVQWSEDDSLQEDSKMHHLAKNKIDKFQLDGKGGLYHLHFSIARE